MLSQKLKDINITLSFMDMKKDGYYVPEWNMIFINQKLSEDDIELLWTAIINMFENDHSAARGKMCMRKLYIFKHSNVLGNSPSHILFEKIQVSLKNEAEPPRKFTDYEITVDNHIPEGVQLIQKL